MSLLGDVRNMIAHAPIHDREVSVRRECRLGTGCPLLSMPRIAAALEVADDLAGLLLVVLDDQIRNGWVQEGSPLLNEPRTALERWAALKGEEAP